MKREFKKGDRVLVRKSDLNDWVHAEFEETDEILNHFVAVNDDGFTGVYTQCRHIDEFRTGDKVQVRISKDYEWEDKIYGCFDNVAPGYGHCVYENVRGKNMWGWYNECRWHPSLTWSDKEEPLTLEQRVEALERKLNQAFNTKEK